MGQVLRAGVAGAGVFGGHHARKYASLPQIEFAGVLDPHEDRAETLAVPLGGRVFEDLQTFLEACDLITVAAPASSHAGIAAAALAAGRHVYVEKPLADTSEQAWALVEAARKAGVVLACGHQERAVFRAMGLMSAPERPLRIEAVRRGTFTGRGMDVSCVLDLMVHDIDLCLTLAGGPAASVAAEGSCHHGDHADHAVADIDFGGGLTCRLEAWRAAPARERAMRVVYPSGEVRIDFLARTFEDSTGFGLNPDFASTPDGKDPLGASVSAFVAAVRGEAPRPLVTAEEAARALDIALEVDRCAHA